MIYTDRYGIPHQAGPQDLRVFREGAFGLFVHRNKILFNIEAHAPDCADVPGGGIDEGENATATVMRELWEETGLRCPPSLLPVKTRQKIVHFYAENTGEYWDYTQHHLLFQHPSLEKIYFDGHRPNPDGYYSFWHPLDNLETICLHHFHSQAIKMISFL